MIAFEKLRKKMIQEHLVARGINDPVVLEAFQKVPREKFIPEKQRKLAYNDSPVPIGLGQTISQPYIVALMTQALELDKNSKVLEIGTGSGYQSALLAQIASQVYTLERYSILLKKAKKTLSNLGYKNIKFIQADGTLGYPPAATYSAIIVTAGSPKIPEPLIKQLKINGKLVIPVGESYSQTLKKIVKKKDGLEEIDLCGCMFVPLIGEKGWGE